MSKLAAPLSELAADLGSGWLTFSCFMGFAIGAVAAGAILVAPAIAAVWLIAKMVASL